MFPPIFITNDFPSKEKRVSIWVGILILFVTMLIYVFFLNDAYGDTWYVGEGLKQGDYFSYSICYVEYKECTPLEMDIWIKGETEKTWVSIVQLFDGNKTSRDFVHFGKISGDPVRNEFNTNRYNSLIESTLTSPNSYLPGLSSSNPTDFSRNGPSRICEMGCPAIRNNGTEVINIPVGTFDTYVLKYGFGHESKNKIWVVDDFPFPVMAKVYTFPLDNQSKIEYEYRLIDYYENVSDNPFENIFCDDDCNVYEWDQTNFTYYHWVQRVSAWHAMGLISDQEYENFYDYVTNIR